MSMLYQIVPEIHELLSVRTKILTAVSVHQPIGRRQLASEINMTERVLRKECDLLKKEGFIHYQKRGMSLTSLGEDAVYFLVKRQSHYNEQAEEIQSFLEIHKVMIARGEMLEPVASVGIVGAAYVKQLLSDPRQKVVGITGGSTIEKLISGYNESAVRKDVTVVSARGGLGNTYALQSNTLAERLADKMGGTYRTLMTVDNLSRETIDELRNEPAIRETLAVIRNMDVLVFGIGRADTMARRRKLSSEEVQHILKKGAVAEAFGYYFDSNGIIVHEISTIGIDLDKYKSLSYPVAVASDPEKAAAIVAVSKLNANLVLIIDERTAEEILKMKHNAKEEK